MKFSIVHDQAPILLVGGGIVHETEILDARRFAGQVVAVDGGLDRALDHGLRPDAVIGDLDSASTDALARMHARNVHHITEQDSTDFDKALRNVQAPLVIGVGFTGGRMDHQMAAFHTLARHAHRACILLTDQEVIFAAPPTLTIDLTPGDRLSLFPLAEISGLSTGLRWPIAGLKFAPDRKIGTSNQVTGPVSLSFDTAGMLVFVPRHGLDAVVKSLTGRPAGDETWPVPA